LIKDEVEGVYDYQRDVTWVGLRAENEGAVPALLQLLQKTTAPHTHFKMSSSEHFSRFSAGTQTDAEAVNIHLASSLEFLDNEAAYLELGIERMQARLAANWEERRRLLTQSQISIDNSTISGGLLDESPAALIAPSAAAAAASAATESRSKKNPPPRKKKNVLPVPEYEFWGSVGEDFFHFSDLDPGVGDTLKGMYAREMSYGKSRPPRYHRALRNPETWCDTVNRRCLRIKLFNAESVVEENPAIACRSCTQKRVPCMRLTEDEINDYAMYAAPLAPELREGRRWKELEYWVQS
jgi:hypothetical protein